jgi:hypothetical protein
MLAAGLSAPQGGDSGVAAQALNPCLLLTIDEIQPLAPNVSIADGVPSGVDALGAVSCRFTWGVGVGRFHLDVVVSEASRMFASSGPESIKLGLEGLVKAGTADAVIPDVGEVAVFRADSSVLASATAFLKGRLLQVRLDGIDAREKKDQMVALLKSAATRL